MLKSLSSLFKDFLPGQNVPSMGNSKGRKRAPSKYGATFDFLTLVAKWSEIVGQRMAAHSIPLKIMYRTLVILSDHPGFSGEMSFLETQLKAKIIDYFPELSKEIDRLQFQVNPSFFKQRAEALAQGKIVTDDKIATKKQILHPHSPEYRAMQKRAQELFGQIKDDEIREDLTSLLIQLSQKN